MQNHVTWSDKLNPAGWNNFDVDQIPSLFKKCHKYMYDTDMSAHKIKPTKAIYLALHISVTVLPSFMNFQFS